MGPVRAADAMGGQASDRPLRVELPQARYGRRSDAAGRGSDTHARQERVEQ